MWNIPERVWSRRLRQIDDCGFLYDQWSCGNSKQMKPGDTAFLLRQSTERGIVARGLVTSEVFEDDSWNEEDEEEKMVAYVEITWLQQLRIENVLKLDDLKVHLPDVHWTPFSSGTRVSDEHSSDLIELWDTHIKKFSASISPPQSPNVAAVSDDNDGRCQICNIEIQSVYGTLPSSVLVKTKFIDSDENNTVCRNCYQVARSFDPQLSFDQLKAKISVIF